MRRQGHDDVPDEPAEGHHDGAAHEVRGAARGGPRGSTPRAQRHQENQLPTLSARI